MSEKSNVERLGEDLKDVAQDATNNEAVKAPGEKISEMGNGETAQTAQVKLAKAAQSEYAKAVLAKLDAVANSAVVQQAKGRFFEEFSNAKGWVSSNWNAGCYGKFRVVMAVIIVLLAFRGLLCGWGSGGNLGNARLQEKIEKSEVAAESFGGYWDEDNSAAIRCNRYIFRLRHNAAGFTAKTTVPARGIADGCKFTDALSHVCCSRPRNLDEYVDGGGGVCDGCFGQGTWDSVGTETGVSKKLGKG